MKKLILLGIMLAGIVLFGFSGVVADTDTPNNEVTNSTSNSSASGEIGYTVVGTDQVMLR